MAEEPRLSAPSANRNRAPILAGIAPILPPLGLVLEVASGTGEHVAFFAAARPDLDWQPSDPVPERRRSIDAWCTGLTNVRPAVALDTTAPVWPVTRADALLCINMAHIAPWRATQGLLDGAARLLAPGAGLAIYGPFGRRGVALAPGNAAFDADLRSRNAEWGIREVEAVEAVAATRGFAAPEIVAMPADNLLLLFRRR